MGATARDTPVVIFGMAPARGLENAAGAADECAGRREQREDEAAGHNAWDRTNPYARMMRMVMIAILLTLVVFCHVANATAATPASVEEFVRLRSAVHDLSLKLENQAEARTRQADAFNADALTISIVSGIGILFVTVGGLAATVLGYRLVRRQVSTYVATRIDESIQASIRSHGAEIFAQEVGPLRDKYEQHLDELYRQAKHLPTADQPRRLQ